jgi:uncharacterized damage-inducible protein DinB
MKNKIIQAYARHIAQVEQLLKLAEVVDDKVLNQKPGPNAWSALQTMHHLMRSEAGALAYCKKKMSFETAFEKPAISSHFRIMTLWLLLYSPIKFKAPKVIATENLPAKSTIAETRQEWEVVLADWKQFFEQMPEATSIVQTATKLPRVNILCWTNLSIGQPVRRKPTGVPPFCGDSTE